MKILIIILLFSFTASGQHYFVIPTMNNPENKAKMVAKRFWQLSRPVQGSNVTEFAFGYIKHPTNDSIALVIDTTYRLPKGNLTATEITTWLNETYSTLTTTQRNTLTNYVNSNTLLRVSRLILTARIKLWTRAEMEARGWFQVPIMN